MYFIGCPFGSNETSSLTLIDKQNPPEPLFKAFIQTCLKAKHEFIHTQKPNRTTHKHDKAVSTGIVSPDLKL